eukprot:gene17339-23645_t
MIRSPPVPVSVTPAYSYARAKELYLVFYHDAKSILRTISNDIPHMAAELSIILALMKVLKKVNVRLPFKYYYLLLEGPFGDQLRACDKHFFLEDPRFTIDGYDALTQFIRKQLHVMDPAYVDTICYSLSKLSVRCTDIIEHKKLKYDNWKPRINTEDKSSA